MPDEPTPTQRTCPICGAAFTGRKHKQCCSPRCRSRCYYLRHKEEKIAQAKRWNQSNKEKVSARNKRHYQDNKEKIRLRRAGEFPRRPLIETVWGKV